jgi:hypothetical protein
MSLRQRDAVDATVALLTEKVSFLALANSQLKLT